MNDTRNLIDRFKGKSEADIVSNLDENDISLEIAIENLERDFNMGTIVRSANAFGIRHVHVIGRRGWNKRGAMMTDKYLHVHYHPDIAGFIAIMQSRKLQVIAVDNVPGSIELAKVQLPEKAVLVFGAEGPGLSDELLKQVETTVAIEQFGSTRSINVGVAAGIVMYAWLQKHRLMR